MHGDSFMSVETYTIARIRHLRALEAKWTAELDAIVRDQPERACHLLEALDDLRTMISRLERLVVDEVS